MAVNSMDLIDQELERAAKAQAEEAERKKNGGKVPLLFFFRAGWSALLRPIYNLSECIVVQKHNKYDDNPDARVSAICAAEIGKPCALCIRAEKDKSLTAQPTFYVPVYIYGIRDKNGDVVTFEKKQEDGSKVAEPIKGFRLLELTSFGSVGTILKSFRDYAKDKDYNFTITGNDFQIRQVGEGKGKAFTIVAKPLQRMHPAIIKQMPELEELRERLLEERPPVISARARAEQHYHETGKNMVIPEEEDVIPADPAIDTFVQGVKNRQKPVQGEGDDGIPEF